MRRGRGAEISPPATSSQAAWLLSGDIHRPAHAHNRVSSTLWSPQAGACTKRGPPVSTGLRMHIGSVMGVKLYRHRELYRHQRFPKERNRVRSRGRGTVRFPNPLPV